jgi:hypothetical protein
LNGVCTISPKFTLFEFLFDEQAQLARQRAVVRIGDEFLLAFVEHGGDAFAQAAAVHEQQRRAVLREAILEQLRERRPHRVICRAIVHVRTRHLQRVSFRMGRFDDAHRPRRIHGFRINRVEGIPAHELGHGFERTCGCGHRDPLKFSR